MPNIKLPNKQQWLVTRMKKLGYRADPNGVCFGIAIAGMQAALVGDIDRFYRRLELIYSIPLQHFSKETIKTQFKDSPEDQEIANEIFALFETIELNNQIHLYPHLFPVSESPKTQDIKASSTLTSSIKLEQQGGFSYSDVTMGVYDYNDLCEYFSCLEQIILTQKIKQPFTLFINSFDHTISIYYNPTDASWIIIDGNELNQLNKEHHYNISDHDFLAEVLMQFTENDTAVFSTTFCTTQLNESLLDNITEDLKKNPIWLEIHSITKKNINQTDSNHISLLCLAAEEGDLNLAQSLLENGADINNFDKMPPLVRATEFGQIEFVNYLLEQQANIQATTSDGSSALHIAIEKERLPLFNLLLTHNINVNQATSTGNTPLHIACFKGNQIMVLELFNKGANIHAEKTNGVTPLFVAAQFGHTEIVRFLLMNGASINSTTSDGWTALSIAAFNGHTETVLELLKYQDINFSQEIILNIDYLTQNAKKHNTSKELNDLLYSKNIHENETSISINAAELACIMGHAAIKSLISEAEISVNLSNAPRSEEKKDLKRKGKKDIYPHEKKRQRISIWSNTTQTNDIPFVSNAKKAKH